MWTTHSVSKLANFGEPKPAYLFIHPTYEYFNRIFEIRERPKWRPFHVFSMFTVELSAYMLGNK